MFFPSFLKRKKFKYPLFVKIGWRLKEVFIGGWFQRTAHLTEVYDFLSRAESELELDAEQLINMKIWN